MTQYKGTAINLFRFLAALRLIAPQYMFATNSYVSFQDSFKKWCNNGVVSASSGRKIIGFSGFSGTLEDTAVTDEKYFYHVAILLENPVFMLISRHFCGIDEE